MGQFKAILTRKYGGIPVWVFALMGVLGLALYLKHRQASKPADTTGQNAAASQAFPGAYPMNYSSDVFINNQMPGGGTSTNPTGTPLSAPTGVGQQNATNTSGLLVWNAVPGATGYRIYQAGGQLLNAGIGTALWIPGLSPGGKYGYQVTAVDAQGNESPKSPVSYITTNK